MALVLAHAFLAVTAIDRDITPAPTGLFALTVNITNLLAW